MYVILSYPGYTGIDIVTGNFTVYILIHLNVILAYSGYTRIYIVNFFVCYIIVSGVYENTYCYWYFHCLYLNSICMLHYLTRGIREYTLLLVFSLFIS